MTEQISRLLTIMTRLRDPDHGCPWDVEQDFSTIAPYTIEEAYEVADAIERNNMDDLRDELGDLLLQVVFHARIAEEAGSFEFGDVAQSISDKMIRRHPHVFGTEQERDSDTQTRAWEEQKAEERAQRGAKGALSDVPQGLPALLRAEKLGKRASRVGFDWPEVRQVIAKVEEEIAEVEAEIPGADPAGLEHEVGDLLFAVAQLARHLKVNPETALRRANRRFESRFGHVEMALAADDRLPADASLEELETHWSAAKAAERASKSATPA